MMDMFSNFENQNEQYVPNNITQNINIPTVCNTNDINKLFNIEGEHIGYKITKGTYATFPLEINPEIFVEKDAVILTGEGVYPTPETPGYVGRKAYNTTDCKSFICKSTNQIYNDWFEQKYLEYPTNLSAVTGKGIIFNKWADLEHCLITITIKDFKYNIVNTITGVGANVLQVSGMVDNLEKGLYTCTVQITTIDSTVIKLYDFQLLVE